MNIKTQIRLSVLISLILVAVISVSIVLSYQNMQDLRDQESLAADVVRGGYELTYLSNDYLINAEPRARLQWEERYTSLQPIISKLKPGNVVEEKSLETIREYNEKTGTLFREIPEPGTLSAGAVLFPAGYQQVTWSRINIQSQGMIYEAWRLRHLYNNDVNEALFWNNILVVLLMGLMLIIIGVNYLFISRRFVRSIREVDAGSRAFASGNLDYRIPLLGTDEIGNIGAGLNVMAAHLKTITASRDELDREVDQRRLAEEALIAKNTDLEAAYEEITATDEELRANYEELAETQRSLSDSERKYRNLYQYAQVGLFETSFKDATIVACNQRYASLAGFSSIEEAMGKDIVHLYANPDDRNEVGRILRERGSIENYTVKLRNHTTGQIFWGQFSARYNYERDIAEGSIVDITAQKLAEESLRETTEYLRNLLDYANAPIIVWDTKFRITRFNHAFEDLTGRTEQEVIGQYLNLLFPESSRATSLEQIQRTVTGEHWETVEIPILHVSGEIRTVLWNSANIADPAGRIISTIAQGTDITLRKRSDEEIKSAKVFLDMVIDMSPLAMWISDNKGTVTRVNHALCETIHLTPDEIVGKYNVLMDMNLEHQGVMPGVRAVFDTYTPAHFSILWKAADAGDVDFKGARDMYLDASLFPILNTRGELTNVVCQWVDVTEREALIRELEQKNAELERFTYTVSHDLKSPLITIKGFAGLIEDDVSKGDTLQLKKDIFRITTAVDTMQALLVDLIELSRVGKIINPPQNIPFGTIAHEAVELLAGPLAERNVIVVIEPDLPVVNVDHARVREVMINLIENAIKFLSDRPDPVIRIGVDLSGERPVFFVQDNGIGINPRYLERIFNLFERLDASTPGTGIGLTIARRIIEVHGGKIWAESEGEGKGTTFRFTLPGPAGEGDKTGIVRE